MRPLIAITASYLKSKDGAGYRTSLNAEYHDCVTRAGGIPILLPPLPDGDIPNTLSRVDGLILSGGGDIDPARYGQPLHEKTKLLDPRREEADLCFARTATEMDLPILAICLGAQVVNVACGGSLIQDIPREVGSPTEHRTTGGQKAFHEVTVEPETKLRSILGVPNLETNSSHHQAIETVGEGLRVCARSSEDGIIEGVEAVEKRFVIAVQWHPERLGDRPVHMRLFEALVDAASR